MSALGMKRLREEWLIRPDWPVPSNVHAISTTRLGGVSQGPWLGLNLSRHNDDDPGHVARNREILQSILPGQPHWPRQVHGAVVQHHRLPSKKNSNDNLGVGQVNPVSAPAVDAQATFFPGLICAVMTADCLPVFFADLGGSRVAVAHAGWKGLAAGVVQQTVEAMDTEPHRLVAWLGPAISGDAYEVGSDVRDALLNLGCDMASAFTARGGRWMLSLAAAARLILRQSGLTQIFGGDFCTYFDHQRFYSYRRDGITGRMGHLIWFEEVARQQIKE